MLIRYLPEMLEGFASGKIDLTDGRVRTGMKFQTMSPPLLRHTQGKILHALPNGEPMLGGIVLRKEIQSLVAVQIVAGFATVISCVLANSPIFATT